MSKHTLELYELVSDPYFKLFDFDYKFYTDNKELKEEFEKLFIETYMFHEIGYETVVRFKHYLKSKLNNCATYYTKLYETELRSKEIDFMLNKDYVETMVKSSEYNNLKESNSSNQQTISNNTDETGSSSDNVNSNHKESSLSNGLASVSLEDHYLTGVAEDNNETENNYNSNTKSDGSIIDKGNIKYKEDNKHDETYELIGKGNIGVTSSADLLRQWREILIDINQMIINDLSVLFLKVY